MDWLEFSVTADSEGAEAVVELFNRHSPSSPVVEIPVDCFEHELPATSAPEVIVKTYLPLDGTGDEALLRLQEGLCYLRQIYPLPEPVTRKLVEEDWAEVWKQQYHLVRAGRRIVVVPAWEEYLPAPGEVVIHLEPGMAFGTGLHPTTRLCLEALEAHLAPGRSVLDVGTGSGILSIAAAKLDARPVLALDTDPVAVTVARENIVLNGQAQQVTVRHGTLPGDALDGWAVAPSDADRARYPPDTGLYLLETGHFDLVLVNILAPVIMGMAPALAARIAPAGLLITAGLIACQEQEVTSALRAEGLEVIERTQAESWVCLVMQRG